LGLSIYNKLSALSIVFSLWAIIIIVNGSPPASLSLEDKSSIAFYTSISLLGSKADVASSKIRIFGFLIKDLAIAILYFCPPDNPIKLDDPMNVSALSSSYVYTKSAWALSKLFLISSSVALALLNLRFSAIVPKIRTGSWGTYPIESLSWLRL